MWRCSSSTNSVASIESSQGELSQEQFDRLESPERYDRDHLVRRPSTEKWGAEDSSRSRDAHSNRYDEASEDLAKCMLVTLELGEALAAQVVPELQLPAANQQAPARVKAAEVPVVSHLGRQSSEEWAAMLSAALQ